ncbi:discoidin domain-containing protein [Catellatospora sp. KI3]|uniref:galactose-binding domain-containing protein n=1 Tax=Catellatospora sp. KI3 TaxID=3041620 RepID=UPI002482BFBC|nr:discoidin domain-containing protein [Catellatospora sp. KI3]MDI1462228.1 discoidin domain-containing protein [Catellatospora sp. KI3]
MRRINPIRALAATAAAALVASGVWAGVAHAAGGPNLSLGKSASASSSNGAYTPGNLNDGNQASYWESSGSLPQWAQVDLGAATSVDQVVLKLPTSWGTRTQTLSVQGSTTGSSFTDLKASAGYSFTAGTNSVTINFTAASVRYVRVNISANTGWTAAQLSELEVYGAAGGSGNLAQGRPTTESGHADVYGAGNTVDGNQGSYWESVNNAWPQWVTVDLGAATAVNRVVLKLPASWGTRTQTLSVQGSTTGSSFTNLAASATYTFNPAVAANSVTVNFTQASTRYVRVNFTANSAWPAGQLSELEVYGPGTVTDTTAPSVPGTLSQSTSGTTITLNWGASTDNAGGSGLAGYEVYRNGALAATVGQVTTWADTQPATATVSYYVKARDNAGNTSAAGNTVTRTGTSTDTTAPSVPGTLSLSASGTTLTLNWGASTDNAGGSGLAGYEVYRNNALAATVGTVTSWSDTQPLTANVSYYVKARDNAGNVSAAGNTVTRNGDTTAPSVPTNLAVSTSGSTITLTWTASTDSGSGLAGYDVFRDGNYVTNIGAVTSWQDTQAVTTTVSYFLRARDVAGNTSANSSTVTRTGTGNPGCTNVAAGKTATANGSTFSFLPANAVDGNLTTYWEGAGLPATLTVALGANHSVTQVNVKLNPDPAWGTRTQNIEVLGRDQAATTYTTIKAAANYQFTQGSNVVNIPVSATTADVQLKITSNNGAPSGQVAEFEVCGTPAPNADLAVGNVSFSPSAPTEASNVTLSATVSNVGELASTATTLNFYLDGVLKATANVGPIGAGSSLPVSTAIGNLPQGTFALSAKVDPSNTVIEKSEANNSANAASPLTVTQAPGPDLLVTGIASTPANPAVGAAVSFTVSVKNRGIDPAGASTTRVVVGSTTLNTSTGTIAAGATATVAITGTWTATSGGATITATADAANTVAETNETNNSLSQAIVVGRGAATPFTSYEAEAGTYQGTLLQADALRTFGHTNFGTESSGRKSVRLDSQGQYVQITSTVPTNSIVVRNSVPDSASGGGQDYTISLYANDVFVQKLTLSSRNSWLYGTTDDTESLSNTPQANARRLFDETSALLPTSYPVGTRFKLQRDSGDNASFYIIDLIDLEQVAPALTKPAECTSITSYGAVANDGVDDTAAIQRAVTDDENGVISCVWIPAGQWRQEQKILSPDPTRGQYNQKGISNAVIRGAGMWYTKLYTNTEPQNVVGNINHPHEGNVGFEIETNTQISDLAIFGMTTNRANRGHGLNGRFGQNSKFTNIWIEHVNVGAWVGRDYSDTPAYWNPGNNLDFTGMRIRDTFADGINFSNGTRNSRVFNSSFRTTGDDSLAVWANPFVKDQNVDIAHDNHFTNNTVALPWRANGVAIYGGYGNAIENNLIYDTMNYPAIMLATDHSPLPFSGTTTISNNGIYRGGGVFWNEAQEFGAITLFASGKDIVGAVIKDTDIYDSTYDGIQFKTGGGSMPNVVVTNVKIDKSNNGAGILAMSGARGNATLTNVTITNSADGNILIQPGSQFTITGS